MSLLLVVRSPAAAAAAPAPAPAAVGLAGLVGVAVPSLSVDDRPASMRLALLRTESHLKEVQRQLQVLRNRIASQFAKTVPQAFVRTTTGVTASATPDTYGTVATVEPPPGYGSLFAFAYLGLTSAGTFGAETVTARLTATHTSGTTTSIAQTFTTTGQTVAVSATDTASLLVQGETITALALDAKSTIATSAASVGLRVAGWAI